MMFNETAWQPDLIIGIDFGMTCTAVAYSYGPDWPDPRHLQKWPGKSSWELHAKVRTALSHNTQTKKLEQWGFSCDDKDTMHEVNDLFKLSLDPEYKDPDLKHETALVWYREYMSRLRAHIDEELRKVVPRFAQKRIEFIFSVPTTWKDHRMLHEIEGQLKAIFVKGPGERVSIGLTEAKAAAVYALRSGMNIAETFVVCDAGGGTTDVNVLKVRSTGCMELEALYYVEGRSVGSALIDFEVRELVENRLSHVASSLKEDLHTVVCDMMGSFTTFKHNFGDRRYNLDKYPLPIKGMQLGVDIPEANIENSEVIIKRSELQAIFDKNINRMYELIDTQLKAVHETHSHETISHLILSGGLGSSPYVQTRMKDRYETGVSNVSPNSGSMKVLVADAPQLAVVLGVVMARVQRVKIGVSVYSEKCCPISLGILCRERYDPNKHQGEDVQMDPYDKKRWAVRQIQWIIKKGDKVRTEDGIEHHYRRKIKMGDERIPQTTKIVTSDLPRHRLPTSMPRYRRDGDARELCEIEVVLGPASLSRRNHKWYHLRKEYNLAEFRVKLLVGSGLKFEILDKNGQCAKEHDDIPVTWEPIEAYPKIDRGSSEEGGPEFYARGS